MSYVGEDRRKNRQRRAVDTQYLAQDLAALKAGFLEWKKAITERQKATEESNKWLFRWLLMTAGAALTSVVIALAKW